MLIITINIMNHEYCDGTCFINSDNSINYYDFIRINNEREIDTNKNIDYKYTTTISFDLDFDSESEVDVNKFIDLIENGFVDFLVDDSNNGCINTEWPLEKTKT